MFDKIRERIEERQASREGKVTLPETTVQEIEKLLVMLVLSIPKGISTEERASLIDQLKRVLRSLGVVIS